MDTSPLGKSSLVIPRIALGSSNFGREIDEKTSRSILDYAVDKGINLIDSSEAYGGGNAKLGRKKAYGIDDSREVSNEMHSAEKIIGRWLSERQCRADITLCTKFNTSGKPELVRKSLHDSLERLQTDHVEIYMLHCWFKDVPIGETLGALSDEVRAGRVGAIGCSNFTADQLRHAQQVATSLQLERINVLEPSFSLVDNAIRADLLPYCREDKIAILAYSPLAAGFLTGKYRRGGDIPKGSRFDVAPAHTNVFFSEKNFQIVENLRALSAETGEPMTRLAMAWVFQLSGISSILIGARKFSQIDNAMEALENPVPSELIERMDSWL